MRRLQVARSVIAGISGVAFVAAGSVPAAGAPAEPPSASDSLADAASAQVIAAHAATRRVLGLPADAEHLQDLVDGRSSSTIRFHIPVTEGEAAELDRKTLLAEFGGRQAAELLATSEGFSGAWIDYAAGLLHVGFSVAPPAEAQASLRGAAPSSGEVRFHTTGRPLRQLLDLQDRVADVSATLSSFGVTVTGSSVSQPADLLTLYLPQDQLVRAPGVLRRVLGSRAELLSLVSDAGTQNDLSRERNSGRVYGGLWLSFSGAGSCTSGIANAQSTVTAADFFVVSAGHCAPAGRTAYFGRSSTRTSLMTVFRNKFVSGTQTSCDCMLIGPFTSSSPRLSSDVLVNNNAIYDYQRVGVLNQDYLKGTPACLSGAASVEQYGVIYCLTIFDPFAKKSTDNVTLVDQVLMDGRSAQGGDSGGPWGNGRTYLGIHQGSLGTGDLFSKSANLSTMNVRLRFDLGW